MSDYQTHHFPTKPPAGSIRPGEGPQTTPPPPPKRVEGTEPVIRVVEGLAVKAERLRLVTLFTDQSNAIRSLISNDDGWTDREREIQADAYRDVADVIQDRMAK